MGTKTAAPDAAFSAILEATPDGVLVLDAAGMIVSGNTRGLELVGLSGKPAAPAHVLAAVGRESPLRGALEGLLSRDESGWADARVEIASNPVIERLYRVHSSAFVSEGEKRRLLLLRDATAEAPFETSKNELFLLIAHDIRGTLSVVEGGTDILNAVPGVPEKAKKYARAIRAAGRAMIGMMDDVINMNKMDVGQMELSPVSVSVNALLASQVDSHQVPAEMRKLTLTRTELSPDVAVIADQALLERVLANLVEKALKLTPAGGSVELSCPSADEAEVRFCVANTGPGLPADKIDSFFRAFGKADGAKTPHFGFRMEMCRRAVTLHGGRIWVESEPGRGARFFFTIARKFAAPAAAGRPSA